MKKIIVLFALLSTLLFVTPVYALGNGTPIVKSLTVRWDGNTVSTSPSYGYLNYIREDVTDYAYIIANVDKLKTVYTSPATITFVVNGTGDFLADITVDSFVKIPHQYGFTIKFIDSNTDFLTDGEVGQKFHIGTNSFVTKIIFEDTLGVSPDTTRVRPETADPITLYFEFEATTNWWVDESAPFIIPNGTELSYEQIISALVSINWISEDQVPTVTLLSSDYFGNENVPGTYTLNLSIGGVPTTFKLRVTDNGDTNIEPPPINLSDNQQDDWFGWLGVAIIIVSCFSYIIYLNIDIYRKKK